MAAQISDPYVAAALIEKRGEFRTNVGGTLAQTDPTSPLRRTTEGEDLKRRYLAEQEQIRRLEEERAAILERGDPVPRLLLANLRESRIHAEELRMWGHRAFVREIRALMAESAGGRDSRAQRDPRGGAVDLDEMKRQYRTKQEQIRRLEAERAAIQERREPTPQRFRFRLEMTRVEAEELRMWGNRELTRQIREATKKDEIF